MSTTAELPVLDSQPPGAFNSNSATSEKTSEKANPFESRPTDGPSLPTHIPFSDTEADGPREYDERATKLWSVYVDEAENHDKALIETWKDDMEGIIIFAGLYSASLTAFLVESYQNLQPDPADQTLFLLNQSVALLLQISRQLGPNGSQVPILPPQALPAFTPTLSDVRVNVFWFMSLVFSLTAALAATIVQSWVRDYMHVFQRYNHSLKRARIRQFLYEGAEGWYMNVIVDGIPALIHISLFLFFVGLSDFLFDINYTTAVTTTSMIAICGALYLWSVVAPIVDAQSPYQSPLSGVFWLMFQIVRGRSHRDNSTQGERRRVSTNMTEGRVQLAMDQSEDRKKRDARAIVWVIDNLTEDSELEPFVLGIPGSLNSPWGKEVWAAVAKDQSPSPGAITAPQNASAELIPGSDIAAPSPPAHRYDSMGDLSGRITRLLKTCTDPGILTEDARRKRARACLDAALYLVLSNIDGNWEWFAEAEIMAQALTYLGDVERIREVPLPATFDNIFAVRWTCMTLMTVRKMLQARNVRDAAQRVIKKLAEARSEKHDDIDGVAAKTAGIIDKYAKGAWDSADSLKDRFETVKDVEPEKMEETFGEIMREHKGDLAELEYSWNLLGWAEETDEALVELTHTIMHATGNVLAYVPGAVLQWPADARRGPDSGMRSAPTWLMPQFVPARLLTQRLWLCAWALRNINGRGWSSSVYQPKKFSDLNSPELAVDEIEKLMNRTVAPFKTQLWRLQDLRNGGTIYMLELLFAAIRSDKLSSHPSSWPLYIGTFKVITADLLSGRHAPGTLKGAPGTPHGILGTHKCLVALLRDILPTSLEPKQPDILPAFIVDEVIRLVGDVLAGTKGAHVSDAATLLRDFVELLEGETDEAAAKRTGEVRKTLFKIAPPKRRSVPPPP